MYTLQSSLENMEDGFCHFKSHFHKFDFSLGGNWEYYNGIFDKHLDPEHKVWVRIPFRVTRGKLDGISDDCDAVVKLGTPYVLNHLYNEGDDATADFSIVSAMVNQFQAPIDKDASVSNRWVSQAELVLREVERDFVH